MLPTFLVSGGPLVWLLMLVGAVSFVVFLERVLIYHREQINCTEFLSGVRNVLKRDNIVEAISICDATPGPVARMVKVAILNRDTGRTRIQAVLAETGAVEVPRLEEKLSILATAAQIAPLLGLLGTVLAMLGMFGVMQRQGMAIHPYDFARHLYGGLCTTAMGLAVAIINYAAYNYLVRRVDSIVLDMEKAAAEVLNALTENSRTP
ncbi:MAG: MotA/TolQ/ExbB proton channel family protein [Verrucomicrobiota bacterium]